MSGRPNETPVLERDDEQIAESLGIHSKKDLMEAVRAFEAYLEALAEVQSRERRLEKYPDKGGRPSLN